MCLCCVQEGRKSHQTVRHAAPCLSIRGRHWANHDLDQARPIDLFRGNRKTHFGLIHGRFCVFLLYFLNNTHFVVFLDVFIHIVWWSFTVCVWRWGWWGAHQRESIAFYFFFLFLLFDHTGTCLTKGNVSISWSKNTKLLQRKTSTFLF